MNNQLFAGLGLAFVGGVALGVGAGRYFTIKALDAKYNEIMEEEIARTKKFYERVNKTGDFATPESAAEALGIVGEAADALSNYQGNQTTVRHPAGYEFPELDAEDAAEDATDEALFTKAQDEIQNVFDTVDRDTRKPYVITYDEFAANEDEYDQLSVTYFAGDGVLVDEQEKPISNGDLKQWIGVENLQEFDDSNLLMVRNEQLRTDYEISRSTGSYSHEVAGFNHSDETFRPMRRGIRRSADE